MLPKVFTRSYIKSLGNGASTNKKSGAENGLLASFGVTGEEHPRNP